MIAITLKHNSMPPLASHWRVVKFMPTTARAVAGFFLDPNHGVIGCQKVKPLDLVNPFNFKEPLTEGFVGICLELSIQEFIPTCRDIHVVWSIHFGIMEEFSLSKPIVQNVVSITPGWDRVTRGGDPTWEVRVPIDLRSS